MVGGHSRLPPLTTLKPLRLASCMVAGALWHVLGTGTGTWLTVMLVSLRMILEVAETAPVLTFSWPVVGPSWTNSVVAETGDQADLERDGRGGAQAGGEAAVLQVDRRTPGQDPAGRSRSRT